MCRYRTMVTYSPLQPLPTLNSCTDTTKLLKADDLGWEKTSNPSDLGNFTRWAASRLLNTAGSRCHRCCQQNQVFWGTTGE